MSGGKDGRTEAPTPKRKRDARRKGQVARSVDLAHWVALLVGTYLLPSAFAGLSRASADTLLAAREIGQDPEPSAALQLLGRGLVSGFLSVAPLLAVCLGVSVATQLAQTGAVVSLGPVKPKFDRINPLAGAKRLLSIRSLWDLVKQVAKAGLVAWLAWPHVRGLSQDLSDGGPVALSDGVRIATNRLLGMVRAAAWAVVVVALADAVFQKRKHLRDLKMTKQEIREEMRHSEGDPHVKGRIRAQQHAMARQRMMRDVATASVVVTNPTHVAVAVRYDPSTRGVPTVVAIGVDERAMAIREVAKEHGVPIVEAPPLARAMWRACDIGDEIPAVLYEAVAKVLVFVRRLTAGIPAASALALPHGYSVPTDALEAIPRRSGRRQRP